MADLDRFSNDLLGNRMETIKNRRLSDLNIHRKRISGSLAPRRNGQVSRPLGQLKDEVTAIRRLSDRGISDLMILSLTILMASSSWDGHWWRRGKLGIIFDKFGGLIHRIIILIYLGRRSDELKS